MTRGRARARQVVGYVPARPDSPDAGSSAGARARRRFARAINIVYALGSLASATGRRTPSRGGSETPPSRPTSVENLRRPGPPTPARGLQPLLPGAPGPGGRPGTANSDLSPRDRGGLAP